MLCRVVLGTEKTPAKISSEEKKKLDSVEKSISCYFDWRGWCNRFVVDQTESDISCDEKCHANPAMPNSRCSNGKNHAPSAGKWSTKTFVWMSK